MDWKQVSRHKWRLAEDGFSGRAILNETNSGFIAAITVEEDQFNMTLLDEREFFSSKQDALQYLEEKMRQESY